MPILVDIVTPERRLLSQEVDMVTLPGIDGQMGVLRGHAPLLTTLDIGEIVLHKGNDKQYIAVSGGVVEVRPDKVTILAQAAENANEINVQRAEDARERARASIEASSAQKHDPARGGCVAVQQFTVKGGAPACAPPSHWPTI